MNGASLRPCAFALILLTIGIAIAGDWGSGQSLAGLWKLPAALLLLGLAYESWIVSRSRLAFELNAPERVFLGRGSAFRFVCSHALNRTLTVEVAAIAPEFFDIEAHIERLNVRAGERATIERRVSPSRLGLCEWPALRTRTAGPLGLAWWPKEVPCPGRIQVLPDLFRTMTEVKSVASRGSEVGVDIGAGVEVLRLRDYRAGDPPRIIDWKATVRADRLISREFSRDDGLQIVIVVDAGRSSALRSGTLDRFGH